MTPFPLYTILPLTMTSGEIIQLAHESRRMVITNGRSILLAPTLLKNYKRVQLFTRTERA